VYNKSQRRSVKGKGCDDMEYKDYYEILGVSKDADEKEIRNTYRKLAKKYHPDLNQGDEKAADRLKEINEAYEVLSDKDKRKKYDQFGSAYDFNGGYDFDPSQYGYGGHSYTYTSGGDSNFSDFFNMIFGRDGGSKSGGFSGINLGDLFGSKASSSRASANQARYNMDISLSLEEAYKGGEKQVSVNINGENKNIKIKWPAGITNGKKIKIKGSNYGLDGDILAKVSIQTSMEMEGNNIIKDVKIYPWQAYYGTSKNIKTLEGTIKVTIPAKVQSGKKIRIPKKGFKDMKGQVGDLYLRITIVNPSQLNEKQEEIYRKLNDMESV